MNTTSRYYVYKKLVGIRAVLEFSFAHLKDPQYHTDYSKTAKKAHADKGRRRNMKVISSILSTTLSRDRLCQSLQTIVGHSILWIRRWSDTDPLGEIKRKNRVIHENQVTSRTVWKKLSLNPPEVSTLYFNRATIVTNHNAEHAQRSPNTSKSNWRKKILCSDSTWASSFTTW